jgi:hypothetical protein
MESSNNHKEKAGEYITSKYLYEHLKGFKHSIAINKEEANIVFNTLSNFNKFKKNYPHMGGFILAIRSLSRRCIDGERMTYGMYGARIYVSKAPFHSDKCTHFVHVNFDITDPKLLPYLQSLDNST